MKYFIDTEFLEGTQKGWFGKTTKPTIDLISVGIVCEDGREYYAISKDFNLKEAWNRCDVTRAGFTNSGMTPAYEKVYWIRENVLKPIWKELIEKERQYYMDMFKRINVWTKYIDDDYYKFTYKEFKRLIKKYGKYNKQIAKEIKEFCSVNELLGRGIIDRIEPKIPDTINRNIEFYGYYSDYDWVVFCWLFGKMIDLPKGFPMYCNDLKQTLDEKAKHSLAKPITNNLNYPKQINEHNALADARWNFELYKFLNKL